MKFKVIIEPAARDDLEQIRAYIARRSPLNAARWFNAIEKAILELDLMPTSWRVARDSAAFGEEVRQMTFGKTYRVLFAIRGDAVHVLMVRHGARRDLTEE